MDKKVKWARMLNCIFFTLLVICSIFGLTYLFRNSHYDRDHILGIREVENVDVVCIGGSSTFVYWMPYLAWQEHGMTSYDLATNSIRPPLYLGYVKMALKEQEPDILVIDVRTFADPRHEYDEAEGGAIRNVTDSLEPFSLNRLSTVHRAMKYYDLYSSGAADSKEIWSYYFDLSKYHAEYERLGNEEHWERIDNRHTSRYCGAEIFALHAIVKEPEGVQTKERADLDEKIETALRELLDYLTKNHVEALFTVGPYVIDEDTQQVYNTIGDIVNSYGYRFLNTNEYYQEMGIDFATDFYNKNHVSIYGAQKYTRFVADYIVNHYGIEDHRGDDLYGFWQENAQAAFEEAGKAEIKVAHMIATEKEAFDKGQRLEKIDSLTDWCADARDDNYTILIASKGGVPDMNGTLEILFDGWNVKPLKNDILRIYSDGEPIYEWDEPRDSDYGGTLGVLVNEKVYRINNGDNLHLSIDGREYFEEKNGLYLLVYDDNYYCVHDTIRVFNNDEGETVFEHISH